MHFILSAVSTAITGDGNCVVFRLLIWLIAWATVFCYFKEQALKLNVAVLLFCCDTLQAKRRNWVNLFACWTGTLGKRRWLNVVCTTLGGKTTAIFFASYGKTAFVFLLGARVFATKEGCFWIMVDKFATLRELVTVWEGCKELFFACFTYFFFTFFAISLSFAFFAAAAFEKLFIWLCFLVLTFF